MLSFKFTFATFILLNCGFILLVVQSTFTFNLVAFKCAIENN